ncbi:MAG: hypothetical protein KKA19_02610 [Candidatus Margulisbacteria bacterium]|nr:hypothetical protein [Candidatus Margulisiibacteriota bacterium]
MKFVEVLINKSKIYTYQVPAHLEKDILVGSEIEVPLRSKQTIGYVLNFVPTPEFPTKDISQIKRAARVFDEALVKLAEWMAQYYRCYLSTALKAILPKEK